MVLRSSLIKVQSPPDKDDFLGRSDVKCEVTVCASVWQPFYFLSVLCFIIVQKQPHRCWDICKFNYGVCEIRGSAVRFPQSCFLTMFSSGCNLAEGQPRREMSTDSRRAYWKEVFNPHPPCAMKTQPKQFGNHPAGNDGVKCRWVVKSILTYAPHWARCVSAGWMCCISDHPPSLRFHPQISWCSPSWRSSSKFSLLLPELPAQPGNPWRVKGTFNGYLVLIPMFRSLSRRTSHCFSHTRVSSGPLESGEILPYS